MDGFIFNVVHNVQARMPVQNIVAMIDAVKEFNDRSNQTVLSGRDLAR